MPRWILFLLAAAAGVAACFDAPKPECAFLCGASGACPDGYSCASDGVCKRDDVPDSFQCPGVELQADASVMFDAGAADAPVDAEPPPADAGALGAACDDNDDCASGFCSDDVCCDAACDGACDACKASLGASADGTCTILPSTTVCRPAAGECDVAESCDGTTAACPADAFEPNTTPCGDAIDEPECNPDHCNGAGACVNESPVAPGTPCGDSTDDDCTDPDTCDAAGVCQANHAAAGTACADGIDEPDCNPNDTCDGAGVCNDGAPAADLSTCNDNGGNACCSGACTVVPGKGACPP